MKIIYTSFLLLAFTSGFSQVSKNYAVLLSAQVQNSPPQIRLYWPKDLSAISVSVYKKLKTDNAWGSLYASPSIADSSFADDSVQVGISYEYKVVIAYSAYTAYGYINSAIELPELVQRGDIILAIDSTWKDSLSTYINLLETDLKNESWDVRIIYTGRTESVTAIRAKILSSYIEDPINTKAVLLIGHVPVPYSGGFLPYPPDGHPDHVCAWPADVYYGELDGGWTDVSMNNTTGGDPRNWNLPGDGKFDQETIPSQVELAVGRVDFFNMPSFAEGELQMLKNYFTKNHAYRTKQFSPLYRALIDDNFGGFGGEAFAASGWKNFSSLLGDTSIYELDYQTELDTNGHSYIWSYGCGGGWYQGAGGIGNSMQIAGDSLLGIFNMMFGSYFGDWDVSDNFLRAQIARGTMLTTCWSGRPHWYFHHMGLGENIGYDVLITQNNTTLYYANLAENLVHISLMGDPSLTMFVLSPPKNVTATVIGDDVMIDWVSSDDFVAGYNIYKFSSAALWEKINAAPIAGNTFWDSCTETNLTSYLVRAVRLEQTASGSFWNQSPGQMSNEVLPNNCTTDISSTFKAALQIYPNPATSELFLDYNNGKIDEEYFINVRNSIGQLMLNVPFAHNISIDHLPDGFYYLSIQKNTETIVTQSFIKQSL